MGNVGKKAYGPRIIVRSIKAIKEGEGVTIAYTDVFQPKVGYIFKYII